jgi:hypothetical protein
MQPVALSVCERGNADGLERTEDSLPIRDSYVHVMLLPMLINRESLKRKIATRSIMRLHGTGKVNRGLHAQVRHPVLHNLEVDGYDTGHFDGATKGDLSVALGEMEIAD